MDPLTFAISQYVVCCRIEQIHDITMKFIQEMVTDSTLWDALPDPFAMYIDGRTWNHYIHSAMFRASHVTPFVSLSCMWRFGGKMSMPSPVDTCKSKRMWEREIYQIRQSVLLLKSLSQEIHDDVQEVSEEHLSGEENHTDCENFSRSQTQQLGDYTGGARARR